MGLKCTTFHQLMFGLALMLSLRGGLYTCKGHGGDAPRDPHTLDTAVRRPVRSGCHQPSLFSPGDCEPLTVLRAPADRRNYLADPPLLSNLTGLGVLTARCSRVSSWEASRLGTVPWCLPGFFVGGPVTSSRHGMPVRMLGVGGGVWAHAVHQTG